MTDCKLEDLNFSFDIISSCPICDDGPDLFLPPIQTDPSSPQIIVTGNNNECGSVTGYAAVGSAISPFINHTHSLLNRQGSTSNSNPSFFNLPGGSPPPKKTSSWGQIPSAGKELTQNGSYLGTDLSKPFQSDIQPSEHFFPSDDVFPLDFVPVDGWTHNNLYGKQGMADQLFFKMSGQYFVGGSDWHPQIPLSITTEEGNRDNIQHCMSKNYLNSKRQSSELYAIKTSMYVMLCYVISYLFNSSYICCSVVVYKLYDITYCMLCYSWGDF